MAREIPVYIIMGFLESGKTTFSIDTLITRGFTEGEPTLLLVCEEGMEEYDPSALKANNISMEIIEEDDLNMEHLLDLQDKYKPKQVFIEYNGMWKLDKLFDIRVPKGWTVVQVVTLVNAGTFDVYLSNMKQIIMDQLSTADMIVFNRCDDTFNEKKAEYRKSIKAVNRRANIIFENMDGLAELDDGELELPYDIEQDNIEIEDIDYGMFYIDAADNPDKYMGKTVKFKGMVYKPKEYKNKAFVPGRMAMTCCEADMAFLGFKCEYSALDTLKDKEWVMVTAKVGKGYYKEFQGEGPVLTAISVAKTSAPEEEMVYF